MLQHSLWSLWFLSRSRHQTFPGVQQSRLLTYFLSSLFLSAFLTPLLAQISRSELFSVGKPGFPRIICSEASSTVHQVPQAASLRVLSFVAARVRVPPRTPCITLSTVRHWSEMHSSRVNVVFCVITASLSQVIIASRALRGFSDGVRVGVSPVLVSIIVPDSHFSHSNGGLPVVHISGSRSDRGETDPLDPEHAFQQCCDFFCLASKIVRGPCQRLLRR